jgi:hypothetical protein
MKKFRRNSGIFFIKFFLDVEHLIISLDKIRKKSYTVYRKEKGKKKMKATGIVRRVDDLEKQKQKKISRDEQRRADAKAGQEAVRLMIERYEANTEPNLLSKRKSNVTKK